MHEITKDCYITLLTRGFKRYEPCCEFCQSPGKALEELVNVILEKMEEYGIVPLRSVYTPDPHPDTRRSKLVRRWGPSSPATTLMKLVFAVRATPRSSSSQREFGPRLGLRGLVGRQRLG